jgi:hypothetical protein
MQDVTMEDLGDLVATVIEQLGRARRSSTV